ncbi:MAG: glycosyltransferase [Syntrophobacterales bacterium]|nr:glycosyltransferase [Syntrophobacterales bacterium]
MKILFIHQNFPGQFRHLAPALAQRGHHVVAMTMQRVEELQWEGVTLVPYTVSRGSTKNIHPWIVDLETKTIRGEAAFHAMRQLRERGFYPDLVIAHPGWGESLFVKDVWPRTKLAIYCEFYYHAEGADVGFDPEFAPNDIELERCRIRLKNLNNILHFQIADAGISPTYWQASTFPEPFRKKITVIHDGINTEVVAPNPTASLAIKTSTEGPLLTLTRANQIVTFVNRNLEPYRGFHIFMRALPEILRRQPNVRILIVGGNGVSYGGAPDPRRYGGLRTWRDIFTAEVRPLIPDSDWARVHFLGNIPYHHFITLLQLSTVHVYLTYPFVLSWSLLEAMSAGCAIVASDTQPLHEVITHDETGRLVNFFDVQGLVEEVCKLLDDPPMRNQLGVKARHVAKINYDLRSVCLPRQIEWVEGMLGSLP